MAAVLGTTFTGHADDIVGIDELLLRLRDERGLEVPMHVDGASGAFVWPFLYPDSTWDFRLESVRSINVSGHKYGLVYPGLGWLMFRERSDLPEDLVFYENYLGKRDMTFTLNFSTGSSMVLAQYYNFVRYGHDGYRYIMETMQRNARALAEEIVAIGDFELVGDAGAEQLPLVAFKLAEERNFDEFDIASQLAAERGWMVPAYTLPPNAEHVTIMRALVKRTLGHSLATTLARDIARPARRSRQGRAARARPPAREDRDRLLSTMSRERWMALLFAVGSLCFMVGPFPGYVELVGPGAVAVTFFVGSLFFTAGGAMQMWLAVAKRRAARWAAASSPPARCSSTRRPSARWTRCPTGLRLAGVAPGRAGLDLLPGLGRRSPIAPRLAPRAARWWEPAVNCSAACSSGSPPSPATSCRRHGSMLDLAAANRTTGLGAACFLACALAGSPPSDDARGDDRRFDEPRPELDRKGSTDHATHA